MYTPQRSFTFQRDVLIRFLFVMPTLLHVLKTLTCEEKIAVVWKVEKLLKTKSLIHKELDLTLCQLILNI